MNRKGHLLAARVVAGDALDNHVRAQPARAERLKKPAATPGVSGKPKG